MGRRCGAGTWTTPGSSALPPLSIFSMNTDPSFASASTCPQAYAPESPTGPDDRRLGRVLWPESLGPARSCCSAEPGADRGGRMAHDMPVSTRHVCGEKCGGE